MAIHFFEVVEGVEGPVGHHVAHAVDRLYLALQVGAVGSALVALLLLTLLLQLGRSRLLRSALLGHLLRGLGLASGIRLCGLLRFG